MGNATSVAKNERWIGGVAYSLAPSAELTGGATRLPAVGAKNWPFGTLVAVELVLPPRFMLSPIPCLVSGRKEKAWSSKSVELKAYDVLVKVRGVRTQVRATASARCLLTRQVASKASLVALDSFARADLVQHALLVAGHADLVQHALLIAGHADLVQHALLVVERVILVQPALLIVGRVVPEVGLVSR